MSVKELKTFMVGQPAARPKMDVRNMDGNIFNVAGSAVRTLNRAGQRQKATEMMARLNVQGSYYEALAMINEYVDMVFEDVKTILPRKQKLPAGKYVVADPCYILNEINYADLLANGDWFGEKPSQWCGVHFGAWILPTYHGDGYYHAESKIIGFNLAGFHVDSGHIAIIEFQPEQFRAGWERSVDGILDIQSPFECDVDEDGTMRFGDFLTVETGDEKCDECGLRYCDCDDEDEDDDE